MHGAYTEPHTMYRNMYTLGVLYATVLCLWMAEHYIISSEVMILGEKTSVTQWPMKHGTFFLFVWIQYIKPHMKLTTDEGTVESNIRFWVLYYGPAQK